MIMRADSAELSAYHDEMLDARGMRRVRKRLEHEPQTRAEYTSLRRTVHALRRLPEPEPPPDFWPATYQRLRDYAASDDCRRPFHRRLAQLVALAFAVVLVVGLVAFAADRGLGGQPVAAALRTSADGR